MIHMDYFLFDYYLHMRETMLVAVLTYRGKEFDDAASFDGMIEGPEEGSA